MGRKDKRKAPEQPLNQNPQVEQPEEATTEAEAGGGGGGAAEYELEQEIESFEELGLLDPRLIQALIPNKITKPTPIQSAAIPVILEGNDVVVKARTGSGKTYGYLLPMIHKLIQDGSSRKSGGLRAIVLVPTRELTEQVCFEVESLLDRCKVSLRVNKLTADMSDDALKVALSGPPDVLVSTPACISKCMSKGVLQEASLQTCLSMLVLDEADLLLSYGYERDLSSFVRCIPKSCQRLLMSATSSADVDKLNKLVLRTPCILILPEDEDTQDHVVPKSVNQYWISCGSQDKLVTVLALLKNGLVQKKVLIFVNSINKGYMLKLFLEQFGLKTAVLNAQLPQNSRLHILQEFNAGLFDYLIATDDENVSNQQSGSQNDVLKQSKKKAKGKMDTEFGAVRGVDFKDVFTVINFELPKNLARYVDRIGRTGRSHNTGASISIVSPNEKKALEEIRTLLGDGKSKASANMMAPFPLLAKNAVDNLRYRAEDIARGITKVRIREARAQDLRIEIMNSKKLKAHFEENPKDLDLLKHDKVLGKKATLSHLKMLPDYLLDPVTQEASKIVKLSREAMPKLGSNRNRRGFKPGNPLKGTSHGGNKKRKDSKDGRMKNMRKKPKLKDNDDLSI